jgi:transposase-like protein
MKLPLLKAFEILFMLSTRKKGMSILEIGKTYNINKKTAELLKSKAQLAMQSSGKHKLTKNVHVDEFAVGGKEKGKQGRSSTSKKTKVVLACEIVEHKGKMTLGNAYAQVIDNYSTEQLRSIFDNKIDTKASVLTDKWKSYIAINDTHDIDQVISEGGKNFKELNILVMLFKGWLRGIHHHVSKKRMQCYIDEFLFRFNRKAFPKSSFNSLISRFMHSKPYRLVVREDYG